MSRTGIVPVCIGLARAGTALGPALPAGRLTGETPVLRLEPVGVLIVVVCPPAAGKHDCLQPDYR